MATGVSHTPPLFPTERTLGGLTQVGCTAEEVKP
jgi:hypothetical protein